MNKWNGYFEKLPINQQDIYYSAMHYQIYEMNGDGKSKYFVFEQQGNIALYPFLINSVNALGFDMDKEYYDIQGAYGYNGVITNCYEPSFVDDFHQAFDKYCVENDIIAEFTRFHPLLENYKFSEKKLNVIFDRETVVLNLTQSYNEIWANEYSSKNRNMIRKAQKIGYSTDVLTKPSKAKIDQFIAIYHASMKKVGAGNYYFFNNEFFYNMFLYLKEHAFLFNIHDKGGQILCSSIFFHYGDYFHYHLSGRAVDADNSVNNFLLDEAIKLAQGLGAKFFHFGGGRSTAANDSLLKFKGSFSKTRLPFYIGKKIHNQDIYDKIVKLWELKFPERKEKFKNLLLKYRH